MIFFYILFEIFSELNFSTKTYYNIIEYILQISLINTCIQEGYNL